MTDKIHLQGKKLTTYRGDYDTFERTREELIKNQWKAFEGNERARAHMQVYFSSSLSFVIYIIHFGKSNTFLSNFILQTFTDKFRYNVKRASLVQSRIKVFFLQFIEFF